MNATYVVFQVLRTSTAVVTRVIRKYVFLMCKTQKLDKVHKRTAILSD